MRVPRNFAAIVAVCGLLTACGAGQTDFEPEDKAATLGGLWMTAKAGFSLYASLPDCSAGSGRLCKDPAVVAQLLKAQAVADVAIARARENILLSKDASATMIALKMGTDAIVIFQQALRTYGVVDPS